MGHALANSDHLPSTSPPGPCRRHFCPSCPHGPLQRVAAVEGWRNHGLPLAWREIAAGRNLFFQGDPCGDVFTVIEGWVILYELLEDGRRQILRVAIPGDIIGFLPNVRHFPYGAQAVGAVGVCVARLSQVIDWAVHQPKFAAHLAWTLCENEVLACRRLTALGRKTAIERCASLLWELHHRMRQRGLEDGERTLRIPLTQTQIADALGLTPVHTNRILNRLRRMGVIEYGAGVFHIRAPHRLAGLAGGGAGE